MIGFLIQFFFKHQTKFLIGGAALMFGSGFAAGYKIKGAFQDQKNLGVIERDLKTIESQHEIDAHSYDSDSFRNDVLRRGRL